MWLSFGIETKRRSVQMQRWELVGFQGCIGYDYDLVTSVLGEDCRNGLPPAD